MYFPTAKRFTIVKTHSFTLYVGFAIVVSIILFATACDSAGEDDEQLIIEDIIVGPPSVAEENLILTVHYTGWLENGTQFDSSYDGQPYSFTLGRGEVIQGWDRGLVGMRVGGKRKLTIPPHLAYGNRGGGCNANGECLIPPNATLIFEVELLEVREPQ